MNLLFPSTTNKKMLADLAKNRPQLDPKKGKQNVADAKGKKNDRVEHGDTWQSVIQGMKKVVGRGGG